VKHFYVFFYSIKSIHDILRKESFMSKKLLIKVLLEDDAFVHIALKNGEMYYATVSALLDALANPKAVNEANGAQYQRSTGKFNLHKRTLEEIPGLTLALIYEDGSVEVIYPILFKVLQAHGVNFGNNQIKLESIAMQKVFANKKEYRIKQFLDFARMTPSDLRILSDDPIRIEHQEMFYEELAKFSEIIVPIVEKTKIETAEISPIILSNEEEKCVGPKNITWDELDPSFVTASRYAELCARSYQTVYYWAKNGVLRSAVRVNDRAYYIDPNEAPPKRIRREKKVNSKGASRVRASNNASYAEVQQYIKDRELVTDKIRQYIRTVEEAQYYRNNNYREIELQGRHALVVDVYPDYFVEELGLYNRDLMAKGKPPIVREEDKSEGAPEGLERYHLHHIGQVKGAFAIIKNSDHNRKLYSTFHQGAGDENLHTDEFEIEKKDFWKQYLKAYDTFGGYKQIPYFNPRKESKVAKRR